MIRDNFTRTPNILFDQLLKELNTSELKMILVIIRQTNGWKKERDRITHNQYISKTGLSRRVITETVKSLLGKNLIIITDKSGNDLINPEDRKGQSFIYYSFHQSTSAKNDINLCNIRHEHVQNMVHNKRNYNKRNSSKEKYPSYKHIGEVIEKKKLKWEPKIKE